MGTRVNLGPLKDRIAFQVHLTWRSMRKRFLSDAKLNGKRIARGAYSVPVLIGANPGIAPQEIAATLFLDASKVAVFLKQLEEDGLIERVSATSDRRKVRLYLTDSGKLYAQHVLAMSENIESHWNSLLTGKEAGELIRLLGKIQRGSSGEND